MSGKPTHLDLACGRCDDRRDTEFGNGEILELEATATEVNLFNPILEVEDDVLEAGFGGIPNCAEYELIDTVTAEELVVGRAAYHAIVATIEVTHRGATLPGDHGVVAGTTAQRGQGEHGVAADQCITASTAFRRTPEIGVLQA